MSRHRAVRGNWQNEMDEGDEYEWEVSLVKKSLPGVDTDWILETLDYYQGDVESTIEYLKGESSKIQNSNLKEYGKHYMEEFVWRNDLLCIPFDQRLLNVEFTQKIRTKTISSFSANGGEAPTLLSLRDIANKTPKFKFSSLLKGTSTIQTSTNLSSANLSSKSQTNHQSDTKWANGAKSKLAAPSAFASLITDSCKDKKTQKVEKVVKAPAKASETLKKKFEKKESTEDTYKSVQEQISGDLSGLGLQGNIPPKVIQPPVEKKRNKLNLDEEAKKRNLEKSRLNIVVIGHVDSGKSTLMGHLLYKLGNVSDRTMKKFEKDAQLLRKGSFVFAWVLDETDEERSRGVTIDVAMNEFETEHIKFTLLDAPGHKDFIPNMINGATQADVALLVIDASSGGFESGFHLGGQTREHAILVRSLGVSQLIVAINKMDTIDWSQSRFEQIRSTLLPFFKQIGFKKDELFIIPVSGFQGDNINEKSERMSQWYTGETLLHYLDNLRVPKRDISKPFRMPINDIFKSGMGGGVLVDGRIESGAIQIGASVCVRPINEIGVVKGLLDYKLTIAIDIGGTESVEWAMVGDHIQLTLSGIDQQKLSVGNMLCDPANLVPISSLFTIQALTVDLTVPLTLGFPFILHHQQKSEPAIISKLVSIQDKSTGLVIKSNPRVINSQTLCTLQVKLVDRSICLEKYETVRELGRVILRSGLETVAVGKIISVDDSQTI